MGHHQQALPGGAGPIRRQEPPPRRAQGGGPDIPARRRQGGRGEHVLVRLPGVGRSRKGGADPGPRRVHPRDEGARRGRARRADAGQDPRRGRVFGPRQLEGLAGGHRQSRERRLDLAAGDRRLGEAGKEPRGAAGVHPAAAELAVAAGAHAGVHQGRARAEACRRQEGHRRAEAARGSLGRGHGLRAREREHQGELGDDDGVVERGAASDPRAFEGQKAGQGGQDPASRDPPVAGEHGVAVERRPGPPSRFPEGHERPYAEAFRGAGSREGAYTSDEAARAGRELPAFRRAEHPRHGQKSLGGQAGA
mmetsp:Transcript_32688/g.98819  ORF Transcript_32688/g.98819 Transcript_32688/m.98819 type:complete len:308 (+) Transcript_32688:658-1581(+)